jgi:cardiolipin synthase
VLASRGYQGRQAIQRSLRIAIRNSVRQCLITTPYFVPPLRLIRAISRAAERGVEVQLLTAGTSDVPIVAMAARHIYGRLLKRGVRIFEMYGCTLHAKTITVDGIYSTVGSFNLDKWSYQRNLEVNVGMLDSSIANEIQRQFEANLESTREVTLAEWENRNLWRRLVNWTAYQLLRL